MKKARYVIMTEAGELVPVGPIRWARWLEENRTLRQLEQDEVEGVLISTVFLGLDHSFEKDAPPLYFESMVFKKTGKKVDWHELEMERYSTRDEALRGHRKLVKKYSGLLKLVKEA